VADYNGEDLDGDVSGIITEFSGNEDEGREGHEHPQAAHIEDDIERSGLGSTWGASHSDVLPQDGGLADVITTGTTESGLEFEFMRQMPLPGTAGCARSEGSGGGDYASIGWDYNEFRYWDDDLEQDVYYDKPDLDTLTINWGDGSEEYEYRYGQDDDYREDGWEGHSYADNGDYWIQVTYTPTDGYSPVTHSLNYLVGDEESGFAEYDDESEESYTTGWIEKGWCDLDGDQSATPNPEIIDAFLTNGPFEVMDEQIFTSNADGMVTMTATPSLPGAYISIVQTKYLRDGVEMTGLGMNLGAATAASISLGGDLVEETTFAGIPVYSATPDGANPVNIQVTTSGMGDEEYNAMLMLMPMPLNVPFPDIDEDAWGEPQSHDLEFQQGVTARNQEVFIEAPISLVASLIMEEGELWPTAITFGLVLNDPGTLTFDGTLGPGQTTNIALDEEYGVASRILAVATPEVGLDPASVDLSAFTELLYGDVIREGELGWVNMEENLEATCEEFRVWNEDRWDEGVQSNVRMSLRDDSNEFVHTTAYTPNAILTDENGNTIEPTSDWNKEDWEEDYHANFNLDPGLYTLAVDSGEMRFEVAIEENEDGWEDMNIDPDQDDVCSNEWEETEEQIYDLFDEVFGSLDSIAWGQGSSADLHLSDLSAPQDDYTVIAIAQIGEGEDATIMAALDSKVAEPNPEPPEMMNMTLSFSPANPLPGDVVQITATDGETGQPIDDLSAVLIRNNITLFGLITDEDGQVSFGVTEGTILIRFSGEMYNTKELTIVVTSEGTDLEDGDDLPVDTDGDGVIDSEDAFPNDATESDDCDGDGIGNNADDDDAVCDPNDYLGPSGPDAVPGCMDSTALNYNSAANENDGTCEYAEDNTPINNGNQTNTTGDQTEEGGSDEESSSSSGSNMVTIGIAAGVVIAAMLGITAVVLYMRGRSDEDDWAEEPVNMIAAQDRMFDSGPSGPTPTMRGEMQDGYEVLEYPAGSGSWWYRDSASGKWVEWV
ncbi:MAG: hypothetical protein CND85_03090, partial [Marine Group II euryarchaeote MED-G33]